MKRLFLRRSHSRISCVSAIIAIAVICCMQNSYARNDTRSSGECVAVLNAVDDTTSLTDVQLYEIYDACIRLSDVGTDEAIPSLVKMLSDPRLTTVSLSAIRNIPSEQKLLVLRASLEELPAQVLPEVIRTLGELRDVASVGIFTTFADSEKSEISQASYWALGSIASSDAVAFLTQKLNANTVPNSVSEATLKAISTLTHDGQKDVALALSKSLYRSNASVSYRAAAGGLLLESDSDQFPTILISMLTDSDSKIFQMGITKLIDTKKDMISAIVPELLQSLTEDRVAILLPAIGRRHEAELVPILMSQAETGSPKVRLAAIESLGFCGDLRAMELLFQTLRSDDLEMAKIAAKSLEGLHGEDLDAAMLASLQSADHFTLLTSLKIVADRKISGATQRVAELCYDQDIQVRLAACATYVQIVIPSKESLEIILEIWKNSIQSEQFTQENILNIQANAVLLCRRIADRSEATKFLAQRFANAEKKEGIFLLNLLKTLGETSASEVVANAAYTETFADEATRLLGEWPDISAAPFLLKIAQDHPIEKYRIRTLRGYLRIARQMGMVYSERISMYERAADVATRDVEKNMISEALRQINETLEISIFDEKTFAGWNGDLNVFRIVDGAIVGGNMENGLTNNMFLATDKEYSDFVLTLECKVLGNGTNAGVQFRSMRVPDSTEMSGYQADLTNDCSYPGSLYDESRRNRFLTQADPQQIQKLWRVNDWNEYKIVCHGNTIQLYLNGEKTIEFSEEDATIPQRGHIGLQIHAGGPGEVWYRNIRVQEN